MADKTPEYKKLMKSLDDALLLFIQTVDKQELNNMVSDKWSVKDTLCHIAFWHNYYAQNYAALAKGIKPFVFTSRGGSTRNQEGVESLKDKTKAELIDIINKAQKSLYQSIVIKKVPEMSYTDRRKYKTVDFLEIVTSHINRHTDFVQKAK